MSRRNDNNNVMKHLKDYMVPLIGLFLILIVIFSIFSGGNSDDTLRQIETENQIGYALTLDTPNTDASIVYTGENSKKIDEALTVYKGEKVIVKEGSISMSLPELGELKLAKLGILKYADNGDLQLSSSDLWINSNAKMNVSMSYAHISIGKGSTLSFSQNEVGSSIYLLTGFAEVRNLEGESTVLAAGQKITISRLDASKKDIDLSLAKESIDDYFKTTDWFIKNNGAFYLTKAQGEESGTGKIDTSKLKTFTSGILSFNNLEDESYVSDANINISGTYGDDSVTSITLNGEDAKLDTSRKTFSFANISTGNKDNDLVFKVYDDANDILEKIVYTVYYDGAVSSSSLFTVTNYAVDGSQFKFTAPTSTNSFTTTLDFITIKGLVTSDNITEVRVNGYSLRSYNGSSWRYHASTVNNNLFQGTNLYEIQYLDENEKILYTNYYTIHKKLTEVKSTPKVKEKDTEIFSDEV